MATARWISALFLGAAVFIGAGWALQWRTSLALRERVGLLAADRHELERLRAANEKLKAEQISPEQLQRLRADHDELVRLQVEIESLRRSIRMRERSAGK